MKAPRNFPGAFFLRAIKIAYRNGDDSAYLIKLCSESIENADFRGPKGEFQNGFLGRNRIDIHSGLNMNF
jgi:hypothetical protein